MSSSQGAGEAMVARCTALVSLLARRHCHLCATATFICKYRVYIIFLWLGQYLIGEESVGMGSRYPSTRHRRHGRAGCSSPYSCSKTCSPSIHTRLCVYARTHVNLFHSTTGMKNNKNTECESLQIPQEYFRRRSGIYDGKKLFSPTLCLHSVCFGGLYIQYVLRVFTFSMFWGSLHSVSHSVSLWCLERFRDHREPHTFTARFHVHTTTFSIFWMPYARTVHTLLHSFDTPHTCLGCGG